MRNKIKNVALLVIGMFLGATLFGGAAYAATGVLAERSTNRVFVDGREVELEAYLIDGSNYVKLRDVAQTVNFNTYWDGTVQIDSTSPYTLYRRSPCHRTLCASANPGTGNRVPYSCG